MQDSTLFKDRIDAGKRLAGRLLQFTGRQDAIVLALPRGGIPVAIEVARRLQLPIDVLVVRKLGVPGHEELAMGAIASGGVQVLHQDVIRSLGINEYKIQCIIARETAELKRREVAYRGDRPFPKLTGKTVILVDDGLATGATMEAAVQAVRQLNTSHIVVAVPVAPPSTTKRLSRIADEVVAVLEPVNFYAVGQWYVDFRQLSVAEVSAFLQDAHRAGHQDSNEPL